MENTDIMIQHNRVVKEIMDIKDLVHNRIKDVRVY